MKVPIMMAILKESETDQNFLNKKILFKDEHDYNNDEYFQPKDKILPGHTYTIEELLRYMINYSDNNATVLLIPQMPIKRMTDIFKDLSLPMPQEGSDGTVDYISAKLYSRLFRVLYNCTYLNEENSAKALELLSGADFPNGLVSAIPGNITVSNKFGERTAYDANGNLLFRELHDCGIVYVADNPYALCVMTKGKDFEKLQRIIQDLSKMTYSKMK
jgi:beta-lactamase class A